ncbi:unnamed protein product, partial [Didymodactylos carnosus]
VSQLSCLWFGTNERTRATSVAILAANFGCTIGFIITPYIVSTPENIPYLLYLHVGLSFIACILTFLYFPSIPPTPPSPAAELIIYQPIQSRERTSVAMRIRNFIQCLSYPPFLLLSLAGGLLNGTFGAWTSLFATILTPMNYTESEAGWFGFVTSLSGIIGGLSISVIADKPRFQRRLKLLIIISLCLCLLSCLMFQTFVVTIFYDKPLLKSNVFVISLTLGLTGLFQGCSSPLIYECLAEIMFPLPESLSASVLTQYINIVALVLLFIAPGRFKLMNLIVLAMISVTIIMTLFVKVTYKRKDEDERKKREKERLIIEQDCLGINNYYETI